jgi:hypothetical protein
MSKEMKMTKSETARTARVIRDAHVLDFGFRHSLVISRLASVRARSDGELGMMAFSQLRQSH